MLIHSLSIKGEAFDVGLFNHLTGDPSFFHSPFLCFYFLQMTAGAPPQLSSRAELPVGIRTKGSGLYEDSESRDLLPPFEPGRRAALQSQICHFSSIKK